MRQPAEAPKRLEFLPAEFEDFSYVVVGSELVLALVAATAFFAGIVLWRRRRRRPGQP